MQEEIEKQTVALVFKAGKFTAESFSGAIHKALEKGISYVPQSKEPTGRMKLKDLIGKGEKADRLEVSEDSLKIFKKTADKYNVDYAIHKIPDGDTNKFYVFFQAKDTETINAAFQEFSKNYDKHKESLKQKLEKKQEIVNRRKEKQRAKEKNRSKERSR